MSDKPVITPREWARRIFRQPEFFSPYQRGDIVITPSNVNSSWLGNSRLVFGLHKVMSAPALDTSQIFYGRVVSHTNTKGSEELFALFCAHPLHPIVPPFPGSPPDGFNDWLHPDIIFMDGTRGRWDFTRYPQLYDPRRPWRAFAVLPGHFQDANRPELWPVTEFWSWNDRRSSAHGGWWRTAQLKKLIDRRTEMERRVQETCPSSINWIDYDVPWFDPLELIDTTSWRTFRDGRECMTMTLQYTAELYAMDRWFIALKKFSEASRHDLSQVPSIEYMGVWGQTITSCSQWDFLVHSRIPIYLIIQVPPTHPVASIATRVGFDGDEQFRHTAFDASLQRPNYQGSYRIWKYSSVSTLPEYYNPYSLLPSALRHPQPFNAGHPSTAWFLPFTSYPWLDPTVFRGHRVHPQAVQILRRQERVNLAVLLPTQRRFDAGRIPHPLLMVIPEARDAGISYYQEMRGLEGGFYPQRIEPDQWDETVNETTYLFTFPELRITILSLYSFPGQSREAGHWPKSEMAAHIAAVLEPDNEVRKYFKLEPTLGAKPDFVWKPSFNVLYDRTYHFGYSTEHLRIVKVSSTSPQSSVALNGPLDTVALPTASGVRIASLMAGQGYDEEILPDSTLPLTSKPGSPIDPLVARVKEQQNEVEVQSRRRFFFPRGHHVAPIAHVQQLRHPSDHFISYPIRIANVHGGTFDTQLFAILNAVIGAVDIIFYSRYIEVDTTQTYNIGFRYVEDAIRAWSSIHGLRYRRRLLEANPIASIEGSCRAFKCKFSSTVPLQARLAKLDSVWTRELLLGRELGPIMQDIDAVRVELNMQYADSHSSSDLSSEPLMQLFPRLDIEPELNYKMPAIMNKSFSFKGVSSKPPGSFSDFYRGTICIDSVNGTINLWSRGGTSSKEEEEEEEGEEGEIRDLHSRRAHHLKPYDRSASNSSKSKNNLITGVADKPKLESKERYNIRRILIRRASVIGDCWKDIRLPRFGIGEVKREKDVLEVYRAIWKWHDDCSLALRQFRAEENQWDYDFSSFEDAFADLSLVREVYDKDFSPILEARREYEVARTAH